MAKKIKIKVGGIEAAAELNETKTAQAVWEELPIESDFDLWGDEIYFSITVSLKLENGQKAVKVGDLGYWPPGNAFCIFYGQTPASTKDEIRPASAVTVFGKIIGDATVFKKVKSGTKITVERASKNAD